MKLHLLKGRKTDRHEALNDLAYGIGEGRGTTYSSFVSNDAANVQSRYIMLANGEKSIDDIAQLAGETRKAGDAVRLIDLPATRKGRVDIFDRVPMSGATSRKRSRWSAEVCKRLRTSVSGKSRRGPQTLREICQPSAKNSSEHNRGGRLTVSLKPSSNETMIQRHAISRVALPMFTLAASWKFEPRSSLGLTDLCSSASVVATLTRVHKENPSRIYCPAKAMLKQMLQDMRKAPDPSMGFSRRLSGETRRYTIRAETFRARFDDRRHAGVLLRWLRSKNALPGRPIAPASDRSTVWAEK